MKQKEPPSGGPAVPEPPFDVGDAFCPERSKVLTPLVTALVKAFEAMEMAAKIRRRKRRRSKLL